MAGSSTSSSDELRRTQQYLAEVIDECVFVERQRELTERRLSSQLETQRNLIDDLFAALRDMCRYTSLMEDAVLTSVLGALPAPSPARERLQLLRTTLREALVRLEARRSRSGDREVPLTAAASPAAPIARVVDGVAVEDGAHALEQLLGSKASLVEALDKAAARVAATRAAATTESAEIDALRSRMDELSRLVDSGTAPAPLAAPTAQDDASASTARFAEARLMAYEKTVQALNSELALLQENYAALTRTSARDAEAARQQTAEVQRRHEDQMAECDAVLGRMSLELEQLIQENAQLKHAIRAASDRA